MLSHCYLALIFKYLLQFAPNRFWTRLPPLFLLLLIIPIFLRLPGSLRLALTPLIRQRTTPRFLNSIRRIISPIHVEQRLRRYIAFWAQIEFLYVLHEIVHRLFVVVLAWLGTVYCCVRVHWGWAIRWWTLLLGLIIILYFEGRGILVSVLIEKGLE